MVCALRLRGVGNVAVVECTTPSMLRQMIAITNVLGDYCGPSNSDTNVLGDYSMLYHCDGGLYHSNTDAGGFWGSGPHAEAEGRGERRRPCNVPQEANGAGKLRGSTFSPGKGLRRPSVEDYFWQTYMRSDL